MSEPSRRRVELEASYGSESALDVRWDEETQTSLLPGGGEAVRCTDCAREVIRREGAGRIVGYADRTNPSAEATGDFPGSGHDFAIIDERFIVDPWVKEIACTSSQAVVDLEDAADLPEIRRLYGDPDAWSETENSRGR